MELENVFAPLLSVVKLLDTESPYITANDALEKLVEGVGLLIIDPLLVLVLCIKLPSTSKVALFVREPVPIGPLVALPRLPTEAAANLNVPTLFVVPPEYVLS